MSNLSDAPYLGEAAVLFALTRKPLGTGIVAEPGKLPWCVYASILLGACLGAYQVLAAVLKTRRWHQHKARLSVPFPALQVSLWWTLIIAAVAAWMLLSIPVGLIMLLTAQLIPLRAKARTAQTNKNTPHADAGPQP